MEQVLTKPIRIIFRNHSGNLVEDEIRGFFNHEALLEPHARNTITPAAILVRHSWIPLSMIVKFVEEVGLVREKPPVLFDDEENEDEEGDDSSDTSRVVTVDVDDAYSIAAGDDETLDCVYFDVGQAASGKWFMSAMVDSETGSFCDSLCKDDGPFDSESEAIRAGFQLAMQWMKDNDCTDIEIDSRLSDLSIQ